MTVKKDGRRAGDHHLGSDTAERNKERKRNIFMILTYLTRTMYKLVKTLIKKQGLAR